MTHDEIETLKGKITKAEVNEQIEIAELLINELLINNECFEKDEYDYEKSYECIDNLTTLTQKIKNKIEVRKIKTLRKRFNNLSKSKQKLLLNELIKLISNIEKGFINQNSKCREEGHDFCEWEERMYITELLNRDDDNNKSFKCVQKNYWIKKCKRCGYEQKLEKEPSEITYKKKRIKQLNEEN